jgi:hypothetical protein
VSRDTLGAIARAGFSIAEHQAFRFPVMQVPTPASPHMSGTAFRDP